MNDFPQLGLIRFVIFDSTTCPRTCLAWSILSLDHDCQPRQVISPLWSEKGERYLANIASSIIIINLPIESQSAITQLTCNYQVRKKLYFFKHFRFYNFICFDISKNKLLLILEAPKCFSYSVTTTNWNIFLILFTWISFSQLYLFADLHMIIKCYTIFRT